MRRVSDNRNPVKDKFGTGKNGFGPGNPQTGQMATTPGYELFDSWQEEMAAVVEGAGFQLQDSQNDQLLKSIKSIAWGNVNNRPTTLGGYGITDGVPIVAFGSSLAANGYQKLPTGLIIQWGAFTANNGTSNTITLPVTFPTALVSVSAMTGANSGTDFSVRSVTFVSKSNSQFLVNVVPASIYAGYWMAIGY